MCVLSRFSCVQLCATPWSEAHQAPLSRHEYWSGLPFPSPGNLPKPGIEPGSLTLPALAGGFLTTQFSSVQSLKSCLTLGDPMNCSTPDLPSITNSWSLPKLMSIELVMPSSHLILCSPLLLLPPIPPSIRVFSNESTLPMRWPK